MTDKVKLSTKVYDSALTTAVNVLQYIDADCQNEMMNNLRSQIARYAQIQEKFKSLKQITSEFVQESKRIDQHATNEDMEDEDNEEEGQVRTTAVETENLYKRYGEEVERIQVDTSNNNHLRQFTHQMDQLIASLAGEQATSENNDDDMVMTSSINVICPISKQRMIEPVKNDICGHVYDKASVSEMIKSNPKSRCPLMGCSNIEFLRMNHLNPDIVTRLYLERNP
ncbi:E3 SUMO-protein ligase NSE2-like [Diachasma alloeum]|uniref:E3 SUMO-protein ligase NSE2-like n=1 Tax=Diachasma alloeum TaxID=454923 RepID=UPI00073845CF|nr:E3 SUMO-protein ligase NSE2-like [Diachasma alloeum]